MNEKTKIFIHHVILTCIRNKIGLHLMHKKTIISEDDVEASGTFGNDYEGEQPTLTVAMKRPQKEWLKVLVHEFSHLLQYTRKTSLQKKIERSLLSSNGRDSAVVYFEWISGKRTNKKLREKATSITRDFELEAEMIAVSLIKKWGLPISIKKYIKEANAYIFWYTATLDTELWYTEGKSPHSIKAIIDMMPSKFLKPKEYGTLPEGFLDLCYKHCF